MSDDDVLKVSEGSIVSMKRVREPWTEDDFRPLRRVVKVAESHNMNLILQCRDCNNFISINEGPNGYVMECACKRREMI